MKRIGTFILHLFAGLLVWALYIWYRIAMFVVVTEPIHTIDDWTKPHKTEKTEYWTMIVFLVSAISLYFVSIWWIVIAYIILTALNLVVFALWKRFKK